MATKKTKKKAERTTYEIAQELYEVRQHRNKLNTMEKKLADTLRTRIEEGDNEQDFFKITTSTTLKITDNAKALAWAKENYAHIITVDTKAADSILRPLLNLPEGFAYNEVKKLEAVGGYDTE